MRGNHRHAEFSDCVCRASMAAVSTPRWMAGFGHGAMRVGINLRGDLATLDVRQLSDRLDDLVEERDQVCHGLSDLLLVGNKAIYQSGFGMPLGRGLLHGLFFYKISAFFYAGSWTRGLGRLYVIDCEIKDVLDECQRRLRAEDRSRRARNA